MLKYITFWVTYLGMEFDFLDQFSKFLTNLNYITKINLDLYLT